jgi:MYXO-CTERM domain-containing protein
VKSVKNNFTAIDGSITNQNWILLGKFNGKTIMKLSNVSKVFAASVLAASVSLLPLNQPASAQTDAGTSSSGSYGSTTQDSTTQTQTGDRDFDWGWLGLLGLAGLAGLAKKKEQPTRYREPEVTSTYRR